MPNQIVKRRKTATGYYKAGAIINYLANHPDALRKARRQIRRWKNQVNSRKLRGWTYSVPRSYPSRVKISKKKKKYQKVVGNAAGTTHTTSRLIAYRTPKEQKFLRKIFRTNPTCIKHVNRFGFAWMGASNFSKTIWYSVCHLKFNNVFEYMKKRVQTSDQTVGGDANLIQGTGQEYSNNPASSIYIGKCTYMYELYNPTNYIITVYIYDLVCKHDTPYPIKYSNSDGTATNSAPENCMHMGTFSWYTSVGTTPTVAISDPTYEAANTYWNSVGMKPTDYYLFNTIWKVKGVKKIVLPPTSSHHHNVVYNRKKLVTLGSLYYPNMGRIVQDSEVSKKGLAGITQCTLFGFEGQIAVNNDTNTDTTSVGTLPGKLIVKCIRKENIYNIPLSVSAVINKSDLVNSMNKATIFTDLVEQDAMAT